jgi:3'-5' exonuclease
MLSSKPLDQIVFFSMKTVSQAKDYESLSVLEKNLFFRRYENALANYFPMINKPDRDSNNNCLESVFYEMAPLSPEFGKIACISIGSLKITGESGVLKTVSFCDIQEKVILDSFYSKAVKTFGITDLKALGSDFCGHGIKSFHFPFLAKRTLIHGLKMPLVLDLAGVKPWELTYVQDTMEAWKMTGWDNSSLDLVAHTLGITRPRDILSGKEVNHAYHSDQDMDRIKKYCEDDLHVLAEVYVKMKGINFKLV